MDKTSEVEVLFLEEQVETEKDKELFSLLNDWDLSSVFVNLKGAGISLDELQYLNTEDIDKIFPHFNQFGLRAKFRAKWSEWKTEKSKQEDDTRSMSSAVLKWINDLPSTSFSGTSVSHSVGSLANFDGSIEDILRDTLKGKTVIDYFNEKKHLTPKHQQIVANCVIDFLCAKCGKLTPNDLRQLSTKIAAAFPGENPETYYVARSKTRKHPSGKLHDRFFNNRKRLQEKKGCIKYLEAEDSTTEVDEVLNKSVQAWLRYNDSPCEEICAKWLQTFNFRRNQSLTLDTTASFLKEWPLYKNVSLGIKLINLDFNQLYPEKGNKLFEKWKTFSQQIVPYFKENIHDKESLDILGLLEQRINEDSKDCIISLLLNSVIIPTQRLMQANDSKRRRKTTIKEARDSLILHVKIIGDLTKALDDLRDEFYRNKTTLQPFIIVIGEKISEIKEFYVAFDDMKFKFTSFLSTIDSCFKLFQIFNLEYPEYCSGVWIFFQRFFYDIIIQNEKPFPHVSGLITYLRNSSKE